MLARLEPERMLLLQAADVIEQHGLAKGRLHERSNDSYCANGAINISCSRDEPYRTLWAFPSSPPEEYKLAVIALAKAVGWDGNRPEDVFLHDGVLLHEVASTYIVNWNNAPERTQAEVVAKLREAAYAPVS